MATVELVGFPADGEYLQGSSFENIRRSFNGAGVLGHTFGATVTGANRVVTLPAMTGMVPTAAGRLIAFTYAGGTLTHDAGDSQPRVDLGVWDASGAAPAIVKGTATEETGDVAEAPEPAITSDQIIFYRVRIPASASVIASDTVKPRAIDVSDRGWTTVYRDATASATTSTSAADVKTVTDLYILTSQWIRIRGNFRKTAAAANLVRLGLTLNATVVFEAANGVDIARSTATQQAENGMFEVIIAPRSTANYVTGFLAKCSTRVTASGAAAIAEVATGVAMTAVFPSVAITALAIRGINDTASNALEVYDLTVEVM